MVSCGGGETGSLLRGTLAAPRQPAGGTGDCEEGLSWTGDVPVCRGASKSYSTVLPFETLVALVGLIVALHMLLQVEVLSGLHHPLWWFWVTAAAVLSLLVAQMPVTVAREADVLVVSLPFSSHRVPLSEVLEVAALPSWTSFWSLLGRWDCFPCGTTLRYFLGVPSLSDRVSCAVVTGRSNWSFFFTLRDPIQFLLDNQHPLELGASYNVVSRAIVRKGECLSTLMLFEARRGSVVHVLQQRGRRVEVRFEDGKLGWMSYIATSGQFLLKRGAPKGDAGRVGASELKQTYGTVIEMSSQDDGPDGLNE